LEKARQVRWILAGCGLMLIMLVIALQMLPGALAAGLSHAQFPVFSWTWLLPIAAAVAVWKLESAGLRDASVLLVAALVGAVMLDLKVSGAAEIDRNASARGLWRQIAGHRDQVCVAEIHRNWRYGLNYYSETPLPDCAAHPLPLRLTQLPGRAPVLGRRQPGSGSPTEAASLDPQSGNVILSPFKK